MENKLRELAVSLFEINVIKFGDFVTKVGIKTPVYIDLRVIISYPKILKEISSILWELATNPDGIQRICGVPYTALPIASVITVEADKPMVMRRKEAKTYGTKKLLEGVYNSGDQCVIIEDVITSGSSILEVVRDLKAEGLEVSEALVIMDREQGGRDNLEKSGIRVKSLYTLSQLINYLFEAGKITEETVQNVAEYLKNSSAPVKTLEPERDARLSTDFFSRSKLAKNKLSKKLLELMDTKKTTLCLAADLTTTDKIIELAEIVGPHIAVLKIHVDIIDDFTDDFIKQLKNLSVKHKFYLMEDRKFGDIGNTVSNQLAKGLYKIAEWADFITVHPVAGPGIIDGIEAGLKNITEDRGIFLITEMSSKGALTTGNYVKESLAIAKNSNLIVGHVCQSNLFSDPAFIQLTPGVKLMKSCDDLGQQYNTPESVVNAGADLAVVGRGITEAKDKLNAVIQYKDELWAAYKKRIN